MCVCVAHAAARRSRGLSVRVGRRIFVCVCVAHAAAVGHFESDGLVPRYY